MNKELTPLEWLNYYKSIIRQSHKTFRPNGFEIIETELKESEKALIFYKYCVKNKIDLVKLDQISDDYVAMPKEIWEEKLKKLKALEIIKELFIFLLEFDESQNEWFLYISNEEQGILFKKGTGIKTYELLKEVLV